MKSSHLKARQPAGGADKSKSEDVERPAARAPLPLDAKARQAARAALAIALVALALWTAADFLPALMWAAILAITSWPLYVRFASLVSGDKSRLAAAVFTLLVGLILFLPVALAAYQIAQQSDLLFAWIVQSRDNGIAVPDWIVRLPVAADMTQQWWRENLADPKNAAGWFQSFNAEKIAEWTKSLGGQLLHRAFMFLVCLIALFVLLRNGSWIANRVLDTADRIFGDPGERLASKMVAAVRGTVNGTIVVAVMEGLLIGIAYLLAGVPSPILFTVLTIAFAMLPFGAWAAFTLAAAALFVGNGSAGAAFAVFGWGAAVMLIGDHFVWPTLVGGATRLPFLFALVGIFGGLTTFGLLGLFLGPVIMAALLTVWREWLISRDQAPQTRHSAEP
jgi:predicted PurR-regulated permease PerM